MDSGADANLLDPDLAGRLQLDLTPQDKPIRVRSLDGRLLTHITHASQPPDHHTALTGLRGLWRAGDPSVEMPVFPRMTPQNPPTQDTSALPSPDSLERVPTCYHDLVEVFSKAWATSLPPLRPYNCAIDLHPRGHLYSLSGSEHKAMDATSGSR